MFNKIGDLPPLQQVQSDLPITCQLATKKQNNDNLIKALLNGQDGRFVVVCGPCGLDDVDATLEYCDKLSQVAKQIEDKIVIIPRLYTVKPRSNGQGFLGLLLQDYKKPIDIVKGIYKCRQLFIKVISSTSFAIADELLYPETYDYFSDLVSYYVIGARSSASVTHRNFASGIDVAVGVKNSLQGSILSLVQSVNAVATPKVFACNNHIVSTGGNKYTGGILRGYVDDNDRSFSNADMSSVDNYFTCARDFNLPQNRLLIDCSHANSGKHSKLQLENALKITKMFKTNKNIGGIMLESYLSGGSSDNINDYGVSKIDECISFDETAKLLFEIYDLI